jgi:hypothetical protein
MTTNGASSTLTYGAPFKAAFRKELRQGIGWGGLGFIIASAGFIFSLKLLSDEFVKELPFGFTAVILPFIGLMTGLAQAIPENRGDRWSFFAHRPANRSTLFLAKALAGLTLYTAATLLPLAVATTWMAIPGHLAMPFDWRMALPGLADLLCGIAWYFSGLFIGMRDARWLGSRVAAVGAPFIVSLLASTAPFFIRDFWQAGLSAAVVILVTGVAAWGSFLTGGRFEDQPRVARTAAGIAVGTGIGAAGVIAIAIIMSFLPATAATKTTRTIYTLTGDGAIVLTIRGDNEITEVRDLDGHPIEKYRDPALLKQLNAGVVSAESTLFPFPPFEAAARRNYRSASRFFVPLQNEASYGPISWYYVFSQHLIAAYENRSARRIGWLGPDGFSAADAPPLLRFEGDPVNPERIEAVSRGSLLVFPGAVYRIDLQERQISKIFASMTGESVVGAASQAGDSALVLLHGERAQFDVIATTQRIVVQGRDGTVQLAAPRDPQTSRFLEVTVRRALDAPGSPTFIWYIPNPGTMPQLITRYAADSIPDAHYTLPNPWAGLGRPPSWTEVIPPVLVMPVSFPVAMRPLSRLTRWGDPFGYVWLSGWAAIAWTMTTMVSLLFAALAFRRSGAYAFPARRRWLWTVLGFLLGPLGFLLMISLLEWPAREKCPSCGRPRVVTRKRCEHCGEPFSPPALDGTEIFEPAPRGAA